MSCKHLDFDALRDAIRSEIADYLPDYPDHGRTLEACTDRVMACVRQAAPPVQSQSKQGEGRERVYRATVWEADDDWHWRVEIDVRNGRAWNGVRESPEDALRVASEFLRSLEDYFDAASGQGEGRA